MRIDRGRFRSLVVALGAFAMLFALPFAAGAQGEVTRGEYRAAVEPICKTNTNANNRILKGVRAKVKAEKLKAAASQFARASAALRKALDQLRAVEQPPADQRTLARWFGYVNAQADLLMTLSKKLAANQRVAASRLVARLNTNANLANSTVLAFNFNHCRIKPARYQ